MTVDAGKPMTEDEAVHICRNPYRFSEGDKKEARWMLCDQIDFYKKRIKDLEAGDCRFHCRSRRDKK